MAATHGPSDTKPWAVGVLCLGAACIAFAPIFVRLSELAPIATAAWRVGLAIPVLLLLTGTGTAASRQAPDRSGLGLGDAVFLVLAGFFFAGDLALWHWAIALTSVANATVLANMAPLFVALFSTLLFSERLTTTFLLGLALAMTGVILLFAEDLDWRDSALIGNGLGVGTALFYALYQLSIARLRRRVRATTVMLGSTIATCFVLTPLALATESAVWPVTSVGLAVLVALALVSHIGGQGLIAYALAFLPASFSSVTLLLQPLLAALLAWGLLGEALSSLQAVGGAIILVGVLTARKAMHVRDRRPRRRLGS